MGVLVHRGVILEGNGEKCWESSMRGTPWHHQSPCTAWLGLRVTVSWVTLSRLIVKCVDTILGVSSPQIINACSGPKISLLNFTFLEDKKGREILAISAENYYLVKRSSRNDWKRTKRNKKSTLQPIVICILTSFLPSFCSPVCKRKATGV